MLREEHGLRVFEKRVLRQVFGPRRDEMTRGSRKLHKEELYNLCSSLSDRLCGLVVRVLGYRSGGPGSIPGTTRKKNVVGLERGALSLVSTN
jgi:hypothetical protein